MIKKCPELTKDEHELLIDEVIKRVLIQAKYYRRSKVRDAVCKNEVLYEHFAIYRFRKHRYLVIRVVERGQKIRYS